ncbi:hypothetical protein G4Y79_22305 [Phototrophicus methaneseepsis]|uniref:Bacterial transcriptional activator domain-containing protein n=1 Tax=Phototrophicus methaneseepsis TaxID=2710758 RepID=A0A7S8E8U9_9CHLR|nr:bacterial transcriptional activator domain-containing protein [Phototrophicus methaneseepsis]QPC82384.1 hypothetical protein G4Y79_22305 [Phototrophicus methaneseepsis]
MYEHEIPNLSDKRVLILYPRAQTRNVYLTGLLNQYGDNLIYTRLTEDVTTWEVWIDQLVDELAAALPGFKSNAASQTKSGPTQAAQALAESLSSYLSNHKNSDYLLYIDEIDRIEQGKAFSQFVHDFVNGMPANLKIAFNARLLTLEPFAPFVQDGTAVVLGTEKRATDLIFQPQSEPTKPQLEVYAFGQGHVLVNGRPIDSWDGALPRQLFYYFTDNDRVTRADIFETFWPRLSRKEATNVFHVTKRKITECISNNVLDGGNYELTSYASGFYVPSDKLVRNYDVDEFEAAVNEASTTLDEDKEAAALRRAIDIYRFPFLQDYDMPWVQDRREKLRLMYADALIDMGRWHKRRDEYGPALGFYARALKEMPQREDIYRDCMLMYWRLDRHDDAIMQYKLLAEHLDHTVGISPSRDTTELHDKIAADVR